MSKRSFLKLLMCENEGGRSIFFTSAFRMASLLNKYPSLQVTSGGHKGMDVKAHVPHLLRESMFLSATSCFPFSFTSSRRVGMDPPSPPMIDQ